MSEIQYVTSETFDKLKIELQKIKAWTGQPQAVPLLNQEKKAT